MKKRWLLLPMLLSVALFSAEWVYKVRSPLIGELGTLRITQSVKGDRYRIEGEARSAGLVKSLSGNRKERYLSEGRVLGRRLHSEHFRIERNSKKKRELVEYRIDEKAKRIVKTKKRWKKGKLDHSKKETLKFFSADDLATLYFNALPPRFAKGGSREYLAAGAEKVDGRVTVKVPSKKEADKERRKLGLGPKYTIVYLIAKKPLLKEKGRKVVAAFGPDGVLQKAYLVAIPLVGTIYVERIK